MTTRVVGKRYLIVKCMATRLTYLFAIIWWFEWMLPVIYAGYRILGDLTVGRYVLGMSNIANIMITYISKCDFKLKLSFLSSVDRHHY